MGSMRTWDQWLAVDEVHPPGDIVTGILPAVYIDMSDFDFIVFEVQVGTMGATSAIDAQVVQATDSAGAGSKNVTGALITQLVDADDNAWVTIQVRDTALDVDNLFRYVSLSLTAAGTAAAGAVKAYRYRGGGLGPTQPVKYAEKVRVE